MNVLPSLFFLVMLVCLFFAYKPLTHHTKWHGLTGAFACFVMIGVTAPNRPEAGTSSFADVSSRAKQPPDNIASPRTASPSTVAVSSTSQNISFDHCIGTIGEVASELGVAPINIVETTTIRMVRFNTTDGSVLVTCSGPDQKMVITRSPRRG